MADSKATSFAICVIYLMTNKLVIIHVTLQGLAMKVLHIWLQSNELCNYDEMYENVNIIFEFEAK